MSDWAEAVVGRVVAYLDGHADPARAPGMARYMRDQFRFVGVPMPGVKAAVRSALTVTGRPPSQVDAVAAVDRLWQRPERESRYAGVELASRWSRTAAVTPELLEPLARWITTDPWWDTCDLLARHGVGDVVRRHPGSRTVLDGWLAGDDLWLTRAAILHMGRWRDAIDREWLFDACLRCGGHPDFFIRKAIGWALRDLAWADPHVVIEFVEDNAGRLSALSRREALKNVSTSARSSSPGGAARG